MLVLAVESATEEAGAALADDRGVLARATVAGRRHGESLAPAVEFVCARAGVGLGQLDAVCVDVGPGLFTGLRVGLSTAKALGFALEVPVVALGSLEVLAVGLAWSVPKPGGDLLLVPVIDARRGQVFCGTYRAGAGEVERLGEDRLLYPEELAAELAVLGEAGTPVVVAGDGARRYGEQLAGAGASVVDSVSSPDVAVLARLGVRRALAGAGRPAVEVAAQYLRPADVRINWERRDSVRPVAAEAP